MWQDLTGWTFAHGGFIDLPISFVADTILLPYNIPNYASEDKGAPGPEGRDEKAGGDD
jgi:uncharacterized protein YceK